MASKNRIDFVIGAKVDQASMKAVESAFSQLGIKIARMETKGGLNAEMQKAVKTAKEFRGIMESAYNPRLGTYNMAAFQEGLQKSGKTLKEYKASLRDIGPEGTIAFNQMANAVSKQGRAIKQSSKMLDGMFDTLKNTFKYTLSNMAFQKLTGEISSAVTYVEKLDTSLNNIRIVTGKSAEDMKQFAQWANQAGQSLSANTSDIANAALIFAQQGDSDAAVKRKTEIVTKVSNVTGQDASAASDEMTAIWNGYQVTMDNMEGYADKMAKVASTSASSFKELATGMQKVAAGANVAGVDFDQLTATMSTIVSVTREAPESVGTALKTVYARMGDLKQDGVTEGDDGFNVTLGDVSGKLANMGVQVLDANGAMRDMGAIVEDIGAKWQTWTKDQQTTAAQIIGGKRQYTSMVALFDNFDKYQKELDISRGASGTLNEQQDIYEDSVDAAKKRNQAAREELYQNILDPDTIKNFVNASTQFTNVINNMVEAVGGGGKAIAAFGLILTKVFQKQLNKELSTFMQNRLVDKQNRANAAMLPEMLEGVQTDQTKAMEAVKTASSGAEVKQAVTLSQKAASSEAELKIEQEYGQRIESIRKNISKEQYDELIAQKEFVKQDAARIAEEEQLLKIIQERFGFDKDDITNQDKLNTAIEKEVEERENSLQIAREEYELIKQKNLEFAKTGFEDARARAKDIKSEIIQGKENRQEIIKNVESKTALSARDLVGEQAQNILNRTGYNRNQIGKGTIADLTEQIGVVSGVETSGKEKAAQKQIVDALQKKIEYLKAGGEQQEEIKKIDQEIIRLQDEQKKIEQTIVRHKTEDMEAQAAAARQVSQEEENIELLNSGGSINPEEHKGGPKGGEGLDKELNGLEGIDATVKSLNTLTTALSGVTMAMQAVHSMTETWDAFTEGEISASEMMMQQAMNLSMLIPSITMLIGLMKKENAEAIKNTAIQAKDNLVTLGNAINKKVAAAAIAIKNKVTRQATVTEEENIVVTEADTVATEANTAATETATIAEYAFLAPLLLIAAAVGVAIYAIYKLTREIESNAKAAQENAEVQQKTAEDTAAAVETLTAAYQDLKDSLAEIKDKRAALDDMKKGTQEWRDAVDELNTEVEQLARQKGLKVEYDADGIASISEEGQKRAKEEARQKMSVAKEVNMIAQNRAVQASTEVSTAQLQDTIDRTQHYKNDMSVDEADDVGNGEAEALVSYLRKNNLQLTGNLSDTEKKDIVSILGGNLDNVDESFTDLVTTNKDLIQAVEKNTQALDNEDNSNETLIDQMTQDRLSNDETYQKWVKNNETDSEEAITYAESMRRAVEESINMNNLNNNSGIQTQYKGGFEDGWFTGDVFNKNIQKRTSYKDAQGTLESLNEKSNDLGYGDAFTTRTERTATGSTTSIEVANTDVLADYINAMNDVSDALVTVDSETGKINVTSNQNNDAVSKYNDLTSEQFVSMLSAYFDQQSTQKDIDKQKRQDEEEMRKMSQQYGISKEGASKLLNKDYAAMSLNDLKTAGKNKVDTNDDLVTKYISSQNKLNLLETEINDYLTGKNSNWKLADYQKAVQQHDDLKAEVDKDRNDAIKDSNLNSVEAAKAAWESYKESDEYQTALDNWKTDRNDATQEAMDKANKKLLELKEKLDAANEIADREQDIADTAADIEKRRVENGLNDNVNIDNWSQNTFKSYQEKMQKHGFAERFDDILANAEENSNKIVDAYANIDWESAEAPIDQFKEHLADMGMTTEDIEKATENMNDDFKEMQQVLIDTGEIAGQSAEKIMAGWNALKDLEYGSTFSKEQAKTLREGFSKKEWNKYFVGDDNTGYTVVGDVNEMRRSFRDNQHISRNSKASQQRAIASTYSDAQSLIGSGLNMGKIQGNIRALETKVVKDGTTTTAQLNKETKKYFQQLKETKGLQKENTKELQGYARAMAVANAEAKSARIELGKKWEKDNYKSVLKGSKRDDTYREAQKQTMSTLQANFGTDTLQVEDYVDEEFLANHADMIEKMLKGDETAFNQLQIDIAKKAKNKIIQEVGIELEDKKDVKKFKKQYEDLIEAMDPGAKIGDKMKSGMEEALKEMTHMAGVTADDINTILAGIGYSSAAKSVNKDGYSSKEKALQDAMRIFGVSRKDAEQYVTEEQSDDILGHVGKKAVITDTRYEELMLDMSKNGRDTASIKAELNNNYIKETQAGMNYSKEGSITYGIHGIKIGTSVKTKGDDGDNTITPDTSKSSKKKSKKDNEGWTIDPKIIDVYKKIESIITSIQNKIERMKDNSKYLTGKELVENLKKIDAQEDILIKKEQKRQAIARKQLSHAEAGMSLTGQITTADGVTKNVKGLGNLRAAVKTFSKNKVGKEYIQKWQKEYNKKASDDSGFTDVDADKMEKMIADDLKKDGELYKISKKNKKFKKAGVTLKKSYEREVQRSQTANQKIADSTENIRSIKENRIERASERIEAMANWKKDISDFQITLDELNMNKFERQLIRISNRLTKLQQNAENYTGQNKLQANRTWIAQNSENIQALRNKKNNANANASQDYQNVANMSAGIEDDINADILPDEKRTVISTLINQLKPDFSNAAEVLNLLKQEKNAVDKRLGFIKNKAAKAKWVAYQTALENIIQQVQDSESSYSSHIQDALNLDNEISDAQQQQREKYYENFQYEWEIVVKTDEATTKIEELGRNIRSNLNFNDDALQTLAISLSSIDSQIASSNRKNYNAQLTKIINDAELTDTQKTEALESLYSEIETSINDGLSAIGEVISSLTSAIEEVGSIYEKWSSDVDRVYSVLERQNTVAALVGASDAYYNNQVQQQLQTYKAQQSQTKLQGMGLNISNEGKINIKSDGYLTRLYNAYDEQQKNSLKANEAYNAFMKNNGNDVTNPTNPLHSQYIELLSNKNESKALADSFGEQFKGTFEQALEQITNFIESEVSRSILEIENIVDEAGAAITTTMESLSQSVEQFNWLQDKSKRYYDYTENPYQIKNFSLETEKKISDTEDLMNQQKLTAVYQEQLKILQEKDKLSQYDVERAQKLIDLEIKRQALEDARNAKTTLQLKRDKSGNFSYQYVANDTDKNDAQREYEKAKNDIYELDKKRVADLTSQYNNDVMAMQSELKGLVNANGEYDPEELQKIRDKWLPVLQADIQAQKDAFTNIKQQISSGLDWDNMSREERLKALSAAGLSADTLDVMTALDDDDLETWFEQYFGDGSQYVDTIDHIYNTVESGVKALQELATTFGQDEVIDITDTLSENMNDITVAINQATSAISGILSGVQNNTATAASALQQLAAKYAAQTNEYDIAGTTAMAEKALALGTTDKSALVKTAQDEVNYDRFMAWLNAAMGERYSLDGGMSNWNGQTDYAAVGLPDGVLAQRLMAATFDEGGVFRNDSNAIGIYQNLQQGESHTYYTTEGVKHNASQNSNSVSAPNPVISAPNIEHITYSEYIPQSNNNGIPEVSDTVEAKKDGPIYDAKGKEKTNKALKKGSKYTIEEIDDSKSHPIKVQSKKDDTVYGWVDVKALKGFKTGGYTGNWSDITSEQENGKLAWLHQKELVLNASDTENMLKTVGLVRNVAGLVSNLNSSIVNKLSNLLGNCVPVNTNTTASNKDIKQDVVINADFPNATNSKEIETALGNLMNSAYQYLNK